MPVRIQRKRTKGWKMPEGAIYVGRPTKWGNPFPVNELITRAKAVRLYRAWLAGSFTERAIDLLIRGGLRGQLAELRGKNLVCWCPLDQPCHADFLLKIANASNPRSTGAEGK